MGLVDVFGSEDRVSLKVNDLINYFRGEAQVYAKNEVLLNGIRSGLPHSHILVMLGENESIRGDNGEA